MSDTGATYETLLQLDRKLAAKGFPSLSEWWRTEAERFYRHPTAKTWAARVGRGGSKSTTLVMVNTNEVLFGDWIVPLGERHYAIIAAENKDEAAGRLRLLEAYLGALRIPFTRAGDIIDLQGTGPLSRRGFRVVAARIGAVSGYRAICKSADELSKWGSADEGSDPPAEIIASMNAMSVTHPAARTLLFSSPWGLDDAHYSAIERGNTDGQVVSIAPSWVANPDAITEEATRRLEPDEAKRLRDYGGIPGATTSAAFGIGEIEGGFRPAPATLLKSQPIMAIDASGLRHDAFVWLVARWALPLKTGTPVWYSRWVRGEKFLRSWAADSDPPWLFDAGNYGRTPNWKREKPEASEVDSDRALLIVEEVGSVQSTLGAAVADAVFKASADCALKWGVTHVVGDQAQNLACDAAYRKHGLSFSSLPWTHESKRIGVEMLRRWLRERIVHLPSNPTLRAQLGQFQSKLLPSGVETYAGRGRHDDHVAALVTAAIAESQGLMSDSPLHVSLPSGTISQGTLNRFPLL